VLRALGTFAGVFAGVLAILLVAVGQLGKVDGRTLVAVLVVAAASGVVATLRRLRGSGERRSFRGRRPPA
jgi:hypothetical protein